MNSTEKNNFEKEFPGFNQGIVPPLRASYAQFANRELPVACDYNERAPGFNAVSGMDVGISIARLSQGQEPLSSAVTHDPPSADYKPGDVPRAPKIYVNLPNAMRIRPDGLQPRINVECVVRGLPEQSLQIHWRLRFAHVFCRSPHRVQRVAREWRGLVRRSGAQEDHGGRGWQEGTKLRLLFERGAKGR